MAGADGDGGVLKVHLVGGLILFKLNDAFQGYAAGYRLQIDFSGSARPRQ